MKPANCEQIGQHAVLGCDFLGTVLNWHRFLLRHGCTKKACEKEPRSGNNRRD